jgi:multidrug efflux pump subunit AcrA (membrane-fusion protein)
LPNPGRKIVAGQFVTGEVVTANIGKALTIPRAAVRTDGERRYVLVVEGDQIARREVQIATPDASRGTVAVQSGLQEGDRVIVSPDPDLQAGTRVQLPDAHPASQSR